MLISRKVYKAVWKCIYCGKNGERSKRKFGKEHIIPYGLGGTAILPRSSCKRCGAITGRVEQHCLRTMFGPVRIRLGLPTRRPEERPDQLPFVHRHKDGSLEETTIRAREFPLAIPGLRLPPPGFLTGAPPHSLSTGEFWMCHDDEARTKIKGEGAGVRLVTFNNYLFSQMIAKIAHSYVAAEKGIDSFVPYLPDLILGKTESAAQWVGGNAIPLRPDTEALHSLRIQTCTLNGVPLITARVRLFSKFGAPEYWVVVGENLGA